VRPGIEIEVRREPVGVVALVTPWNFPVAAPAWKIAPALAYGNAVVWKPANLTPACAAALAQVIARSGLPDGALWMVAKMAFFFFLFARVKAIVPRYRYDQLMRLGWKIFLPLSLFFVFAISGYLMATGHFA
jgi:hypothetical protein